LKTSKLGAEALAVEKGGVAYVTFPRLGDPQVLLNAVSCRLGGVSEKQFDSLNVSFKVGDEPVRVEENRSLLSRATGMDLSRAVWVDQVHGEKVLKLETSNLPRKGGSLGEGDAIISNLTNVPLAILVADCLSVLIYDMMNKAIGLAHAGWKGTVSHVAVKTLLAMGEAYGTKPQETKAVLGPCLGPCCFEVGSDVHQEFIGVFPWAQEVLKPSAPGHWKLDLPEANARQLLEVGVKEQNLIKSGICTVKNIELFYSHRAEGAPEKPTGRVGAFLMLKD
jgi:polyphenol oxidase